MSGLVLASRSLARARLLADAGVAFEAIGSDVDEAELKRTHSDLAPREVAVRLSEAKALAVSKGRRALVLGADQILELDGVLFDKPGSMDALRRHLVALRGRTHRLHAALALAQEGAVVWRYAATAELTMRAFSDAFLEAYMSQDGAAARSCVGGYRLEGPGAQLFERVEGDYFTVLGLPLLPLLEALRRYGVAAA